MQLFRRRTPKQENRSSKSSYAAGIMAARQAYISGQTGLSELTSTAQAAISLWESAFALCAVEGTELLDRRSRAILGRSVALRGEALFWIRGDRLVPCSDWEVATRNSKPTAYRVSISDTGGGASRTLLAEEVLHFCIGCDASAPYYGTPPLKRAQLTANLLHAVESALAEIYQIAPIGTSIVPYPEAPQADIDQIAASFRGRRGTVLIRESVHVAAAGGPGPSQDWKPQEITPDLQKAMTRETLQAARDGISLAFGVLPALTSSAATGPLVREAQRHLAQWMLQPMAAQFAEECTEKLETPVAIDIMQPLQAFDIGGRARALSAIVGALAQAKESDLDPALALQLVNLDGNQA